LYGSNFTLNSGTPATDCCESNGTPGCSGAACEAAVCEAEPFCCDVTWDTFCAQQAGDLCGALCSGGEVPDATAYIAHHGRTEALVTTTLNANTLLIEVPNRFRLLPGVAQLWVERDNLVGVVESSATLDMPVTYPRPRLDAVNPNLWAADPSLATVPVQVIDRKTLLGTDTFIARRDYYIKMRDELWTGTFAGGVPADVYFPSFDFNALPAFPAVLFDYPDDVDGKGNLIGPYPIPRFVQPIDSGIHNVRLAEHNYDRPGLVDVVLCNPGPGGGASETLVLNIAAPVPVATELVPAEVEPGGDGFELIVRGPANVPTWPGYEEPKAGNFNAASVVRFNGFDLETRFVSSFELRAQVPAKMIGQAGTGVVTTFTDGNDSVYFEQLIDGDGLSDCCLPHPDGGCDTPQCQDVVCDVDPFCCDILWDADCADAAFDLCQCEDGIIFQGNLDSGGESAPLFLTVAYRQPAIDLISPPEGVRSRGGGRSAQGLLQPQRDRSGLPRGRGRARRRRAARDVLRQPRAPAGTPREG
jgi:hypothetical protein